LKIRKESEMARIDMSKERIWEIVRLMHPVEGPDDINPSNNLYNFFVYLAEKDTPFWELREAITELLKEYLPTLEERIKVANMVDIKTSIDELF